MTREQYLEGALYAILDAVDYTRGACRVNEMVGAVLPQVLIENARAALKSVEKEGEEEDES